MPKSGSGIFAVGNAEVDLALREDVRETVVNDFAARRSDNVTDKENFQVKTFLEKRRRPLGAPATPDSLGTHDTGRMVRSGPLRRAVLGPEPHE